MPAHTTQLCQILFYTKENANLIVKREVGDIQRTGSDVDAPWMPLRITGTGQGHSEVLHVVVIVNPVCTEREEQAEITCLVHQPKKHNSKMSLPMTVVTLVPFAFNTLMDTEKEGDFSNFCPQWILKTNTSWKGMAPLWCVAVHLTFQLECCLKKTV